MHVCFSGRCNQKNKGHRTRDDEKVQDPSPATYRNQRAAFNAPDIHWDAICMAQQTADATHMLLQPHSPVPLTHQPTAALSKQTYKAMQYKGCLDQLLIMLDCK